MSDNAKQPESARLHAGRFRLSLDKPLIMGVLNLTPDSFSDGGSYLSTRDAVDAAAAMIEAGADILDLGAESTRPGAQAVNASIQCQRLLPVLEALNDADIPISVDTRDPIVMAEVLTHGASMINDVQALLQPGALEVVARSKAAVCLMHMKGQPLTMQHAPVYRDVVSDVEQFLHSRVVALHDAGISRERVVVDPGLGFGKTLEHNLALLRSGTRLRSTCGAPVLIGVSRKSMLGELTGRPVGDRLAASLAAALGALLHGASVLRVHDVGPTRDAVRVWRALTGSPND